MVLIIGGAYQGKLEYAMQSFNFSKEDICFCSLNDASLDVSKKLICGLHLFIRAALDSSIDPEEYLSLNLQILKDKIIICDDISSGVVPLGAELRQWREVCGRCLRFLSHEAESVIHISCGIASTLK